jgi:hypothetical protein
MNEQWFLERAKEIYAQRDPWDRETICDEVRDELTQQTAAGRFVDNAVSREAFNFAYAIETKALSSIVDAFIERREGRKPERAFSRDELNAVIDFVGKVLDRDQMNALLDSALSNVGGR